MKTDWYVEIVTGAAYAEVMKITPETALSTKLAELSETWTIFSVLTNGVDRWTIICQRPWGHVETP